MRDGHRAALLQQKLRHRLADNVGAADNNRVQPGQIAKMILKQQQAAIGGAGNQRILAGRQPPGIDHMKAVNILVRRNGIDHRGLVDLRPAAEAAQGFRRRRHPRSARRSCASKLVLAGGRRQGACSMERMPAAVVRSILLRT